MREAAFLSCMLVSCSARLPAGRQADAGPRATDAASDAREAGVAMVVEAASTTDDAALPRASDGLAVRAHHLLEAVTQDDVALASDILFPRDAWLATHDAADPSKDWDVHVATPFRKAVHALSRRQHNLNQIQAVSIELGSTMAQTTPRRHGWKKPLWTLSGSRLTFIVDGHTRTLNVREMVAWRGDWYVTRLR